MERVEAFDRYEALLLPARRAFAGSSWVSDVVTRRLDPPQFELFLMWFSALGCQMTRPVDGWIRSAGNRCIELGVRSLGEALSKHAEHEAGHDRLFEKDARALAAQWNARGGSLVDANRLLAHPPTPGVQRYISLHESVIVGPTPYAQLAIEYEIERLSIEWGPSFLTACRAVLGLEIEGCLSFLQDHVALDVGHTHFNTHQMRRVLSEHVEFLEPLVAAGAEALDCYNAFLTDCLTLSRSRVAFGAT